MSTDYEYQYEDDYGGRVLWGRVAFFGVALVLAFLLGTCVGGGDSGLQTRLDEQEQQVMTLRAANDELEQQLEAAGAGGDEQPETAQTPPSQEADTSTPAEESAPGEGGAAEEQTATEYTVKPNDTLYAIAQSVYGDGTQWRIIADANNLTQDDHIRVGQTLRIPPKP